MEGKTSVVATSDTAGDVSISVSVCADSVSTCVTTGEDLVVIITVGLWTIVD